MTRAKACLVTLLALGSFAAAHAQGTNDNIVGGTATTRGGVKTGKGPLTQPIPPAVSTTNPNQNLQQVPLRPQNIPGPALTNPSPQPFGSR